MEAGDTWMQEAPELHGNDTPYPRASLGGSPPIIGGSPSDTDWGSLGLSMAMLGSSLESQSGFDGPGLITLNDTERCSSSDEEESSPEIPEPPASRFGARRKRIKIAEQTHLRRISDVNERSVPRRQDLLCKRYSVATLTLNSLVISSNPIYDESEEDESDPPAVLSESDKKLNELYDILEIPPEKREELAKINTAPLYDPKEFRMDPASNSPSAASFTQLILWITDLKVRPRDQAVFLRTFPSFETPANVMAALLTRYYANPKAENSNVRDERELRLLRCRILSLLSVWMKNRVSYQWENNHNIEAIEKFIDFVKGEETGRSEINSSARVLVLQAALDVLKGGESVVITSFEEPPALCLPNLPEKEWMIEMIEPAELARQVTIYHKEIFQRIGHTELFAAIWGTKKSGEAKNLAEMTEHFDRFSRYVQVSIICAQEPKERARLYWYWVEVAEEFRKIRNFHGMFSVMCGVTHRSVERLWRTMKLVSKASKKEKKMLEDLTDLIDFGANYGNYRTMLAGLTGDYPCVPFIGCFQKDLVYVQESFPNLVDGLINVKKCHECFDLVTFVMQKQDKGHYDFTFYTRIRELITTMRGLPETAQIMKLSMAAEPKQA